MKIKIMIGFICIAILLNGCSPKEVAKQPFEGNLDKITAEINKTNMEIETPKIAKPKRCRATLYEGKLKLNVHDKTISGVMNITIVNETEETIKELCLRNYAASILEKNKGTSEISSVMNADTKENYNIEMKEDSSVVYVSLNTPLNPDDSITLSVQFCTDVPKQDYRFGYHEDDGKFSFLLTYCYPVLAMYENSAWLEYPYISHAESNYHTLADYKIDFKLPEGYTIVATGDELVENNIARITAENIRDFACVVSNYMNTDTIYTGDTKINLHSLDYDNLDGYNEISLLAGRDSINLMETLVGKYPYEEIDIVQCFYSSAMEYPGLILIGYPDVDSPENIGKSASFEGVCSRIAHEIAHQWFYATVGSNCYKEAWLDEGFSEYFEDVVYPLSGCESVKKAVLHDNSSSFWGCMTESEMDNYMSGISEQRPQEQMINLSYEDYKKEMYSLYVYDGGSSLLHELRKELGDGPFFRMLQAYYEMGYMKEVTTKDFVALVRLFDNSEKIDGIIAKYIAE